jgi:hypothetical protein
MTRYSTVIAVAGVNVPPFVKMWAYQFVPFCV